MVLGNGGSIFFLEYLNTHSWVLILLVPVHGMFISRIVLDNGKKKVNQLHSVIS